MKRRATYTALSVIIALAVAGLLYFSLGSSITRTFRPGAVTQYTVWRYNKSDSLLNVAALELHILPSRFFLVQREVNWVLTFDSTANVNIRSEEKTGVVENANSVWIHPPRMNFLRFTEFAPFPRVELASKSGSVYYATTLIGPGWGEATGKPIHSFYRINSVDTLNGRFLISAYARSAIGQYALDFSFDLNLGFTELDYKLPDGEKVTIRRN